MRSLLVYGAGGHARETAWLASRANWHGESLRVEAYVDDARGSEHRSLAGARVVTLDEATREFAGAAIVIAVGDPAVRARLAHRARDAGFEFATLIDPTSIVGPRVTIAEGTTIAAGCVVTVDVRIGGHVQINVGCTISHDCSLEEYATLAPGVHLSGNVRVEARARLGTGAVVKNGVPGSPLVVGRDALVGAGACVVRAIPAGATVMGVPARPKGA